MKKTFLFLLIVLMTGLLVFSRSPVANAQTTTPVTVTIWKLVQIDDPDSGKPFSVAGDFYAKVKINGFDYQTSSTVSIDPGFGEGVIYTLPVTFYPFWTFTRDVELSQGTTSIEIQIWDADDPGFPLFDDDDQVDINPAAGARTLTLTLDLSTGNWTGDIPPNQTFAQGEGDSDRSKIFFTISTQSGSGDADGDSLLDGWETRGLDTDGDGTIDVDLPTMGANPQRKDLFLEIDCFAATNHSHCPLQGAIQNVVQSFANAPVNNVDGTTGIQLHIDIGNLYSHPALPSAGFATNVTRTAAPAGSVTGNFGNFGGGGNQIAEAGNLIVDWDGATGNPATNFFTLKAANFNSQRDLIFRYGLFVHQTNARQAANDCTSGWAKGIPGVNFLVSLGGTGGGTAPAPCWTTDAGGNSVGSQSEQAGTLMHEFGHSLGLQHGGGDGVNNKPNYLSVMNYSFQACGVTTSLPALPGGCDFSRNDLPDLNEVLPPGLDECVGIDGGLGLGAVDWDGDTTLEGVTNCQPPNSSNVSANINGDFNDTNGNGTQDPGEANVLGTLTGFEDWNSIVYNFRTGAGFQSGGTPVENEPNPETIAQARAFLTQLLQPVLNVDKTGPADAIPGDTLNYTIKVTNNGHGPALNSVLTDTKPDSTQAIFNPGTIVLGAEIMQNVSFAVPCSTTDLTVLKNSAAVAGEDMLGNPVSGSDSVQTTVHTPVLTLSKTATSSINAGEAILYTITYENTGSGEATNVVITDMLPVGVYYSKALDLGAGPQPDTVKVNSDGTRTLTWQIGNLAGNSGPQTIQYTARPSLLFLGGESLSNSARLTFQNANGCTFSALTASASTTITTVAPTGDPRTLGFWRNHSDLWTDEILARIQATDQRYDTDGNGALSAAEVTAMLAPGGNQPKVLQMQLIAIYFNIATRRINAATLIESKTADQLGLNNVAEAAVYAMDTLALPVSAENRARYDDATKVLDEINSNKSEVY
jgi:uncharacterized repeat protein (TIGR01451 family)